MPSENRSLRSLPTHLPYTENKMLKTHACGRVIFVFSCAVRLRTSSYVVTAHSTVTSQTLTYNIKFQVQSDTDSSSPVVELNSATEISTDSEFEQDPITRDTQQIFADNSHLKKPTRVQVSRTLCFTTNRRNNKKLF